MLPGHSRQALRMPSYSFILAMGTCLRIIACLLTMKAQPLFLPNGRFGFSPK